MYSLIVRLMIISAILELGSAASGIGTCRSRQCVRQVEKAARAVLKVEWKPISVFRNEARRFH